MTTTEPEQGVEQAEVKQPASVLDQIMTGEEVGKYVKVLIYGDPGAGKTLFAASAPRPLMIDTENSSRSLLDFPDLLNKAKILRLKSFNDLNQIFWLLMNNEVPDVETVVIDTVSELQRRNLDEIMAKAYAQDNNRNPFLPHQGDYKYSTESMRKMVTMFRDLPYHLIVTAHRIEDKDDTGRVFVRPEVTPKLASTLKGVFDLQGFMTYETTEDGSFKNTLLTRQTRNVEAKSRLKYLPTTIENPTFDDILKAHTMSRAQQQENELPQQEAKPNNMFSINANKADGEAK